MAWNDFMKRLVVGKQHNSDFKRTGLPQNRRQVLGFVYKNKGLTVLYNNLLIVLFSLPLFAISVIYFLYGMRNGSPTSAEQANSILIGKFVMLIPSLMIASIGLAGAVYVTRKLCWNEPVFFWKDFKRGIKNSFSQYLAISFITGIVMYLFEALRNVFTVGIDKYNFLTVCMLAVLGVLFVLYLMVTVYAFALSAQYNMKLFTVYKAAIMLSVRKLFKNILMIIIAFLPISVLFWISYPIPYLIAMCILAFGGAAFSLLVCFLFTASVFDTFINARNYPEYVGKGISSPVSEDEEVPEVSDEDIDSLARSLTESDEEKKQ